MNAGSYRSSWGIWVNRRGGMPGRRRFSEVRIAFHITKSTFWAVSGLKVLFAEWMSQLNDNAVAVIDLMLDNLGCEIAKDLLLLLKITV